eukprot:TRINITY_DN64430_c1_g1_i1.p1 TRINITY_DN64430_c1_g1~~TRINITY_DN64430_c1_g1_i1.p1  ORF type:complete len:313 (+),score=20.86 TRINITY_DN64430_c1_g1_i1:73-939(+)
MSVQTTKSKSLKDSILEKLPAKKQQKVLKGYNLGRRYLKTPSKEIKNESELFAKPVVTVIERSMQTEENTPREAMNETIGGYSNLNITSSALDRNQCEDLKSVISTITTGKKDPESDTRSFEGSDRKPSLQYISVATGEACLYPTLTTTTLEPVDILIEKKVPVKRKDSLIKKAIDKTMMAGPQPGLPIGIDSTNQLYDNNESLSILTEEALSVRNSLCEELSGFSKGCKRSGLRRGKSMEIVKTASNSETVTENSDLEELKKLKKQAIANNKEIYSIALSQTNYRPQ